MVLYKKKNADLAPVDNALDRLLLLFALNYPFVEFIRRDPSAMARVPQLLHSSVNFVALALLIGTIVLGLAWFARQIQRAVTRQPLNVPKYLLLAAAIPMHWVVLLTPMPNKPIAIVAILTIYHNLQYHRLIWFHNQKYQGPAPLREKFGAAELISRRLLYYIAFGILFGLIYQGPRQYLGYLVLRNHPSAAGLGEPSFAIQLGISFLWGYAFIHYYLDSKIWRVRRDPAVGQALNMS
jgi:hypothetical protein